MGKIRLGWPDWGQATVSVTPSASGGAWDATLALENVWDRDLSLVARSDDTELSSTRGHFDLGASREVGILAIPKHTLSKSGAYVRWLAQLQTFLFDYEAGDDITVRGGTFARASTATYVDRNGVLRTAASGVLRDSHFIGGYRHTLTEPESTNLCLQASNFGTTWVAVDSPSRVAAAHTASGVTLDLLGDEQAAAFAEYEQTVTFTGDGVKAVAIYVKEGTIQSAGGSAVQLRDTTAGALRLNATVTWVAHAPSVSIIAATGTYLGSEAMADGVYRLLFAALSVTAANTNKIQVYPAGVASNAHTGNIYAGGVQTENLAVPTSFILTTTGTVTRAVDALKFATTFNPQGPLSLYVDVVDLGSQRLGAGHPYATIGIDETYGGGVPYFIVDPGGTTTLNATYTDGVTSPAGANNVTLTYGQRVELCGAIDSSFRVQLGTAVDGGSVTLSALSAPGVVGGAVWPNLFISLNRANATSGIAAFRSVRVLASASSITAMRASVYDSGWLDAWPSDITAEQAARRGLNVAHILIPSSAQTARYLSLQTDDYSNANGYVDLARVFIGKLYDPSVNAAVGAGIGLLDSSKRTETDGGADVFDVKSKRRTMRFVLPSIEESEAFDDVWDIKESAGTTGQIMAVYNDTDSTSGLLSRRSFLGTLEELGILEEPNVDRRYATAFVIREAL